MKIKKYTLRPFGEIHCVWPKTVFAFLTRRICPVLVISQYVARIIKTQYPRCHKRSLRASASSKKKLSSIIAAFLGNSLLLAKKGFLPHHTKDLLNVGAMLLYCLDYRNNKVHKVS